MGARQSEVEESYSYSENFYTSYELFYPTETKWREKTIEDFKEATLGVLKAKLK